jgi:hypothetical protein
MPMATIVSFFGPPPSSAPAKAPETDKKEETSSSSTSYDSAKAANDVLKSLLHSPQVLEALANQSSKYVPPTFGRIMAILWGLLNSSGNSLLTKDEVKLAVFSVGSGSTNDIDSFWEHINPDKTAAISAGDFTISEKLRGSINKMTDELMPAVDEARIKNESEQGGSSSILDYFV